MGRVTRFTPRAQRDLLKIERSDTLRILRRLAELQRAMDAGDTTAFDVKALRGHDARWRLGVGDHRVVCAVENGQLIVWVLGVGHRSEVYRQLP
ncbi:type II toxin-antitoxin system RelE/ParE family toxin [Kitasatospora sp. NA04385]|uniref:type II toxin-antitoxin system RelE family toxin n=1 Tax=Kitasatospora sp. NA04385 TaxID=2742135 RepID=UPI00158FA7B3|nr:type II toxin-antitoxin system RelE/ParE family toxin [Kitasatospora sp. NA04385]QKW18521.1 type II toxin-antitoxin system RelE/ParE family toxin [Kitasatospora sp. NA04385]